MKKRLVFDIGMHIGQDTVTYLREGFRVLAIEANPVLAEQNKRKFKRYITDGSLTILNVGIADKEGVLPFYINKKTSEWSSFDFNTGARNNTPYEVLNVPCVTTGSLFRQYDIPHFLKVDIEGYDVHCVDALPDVTSGNGIKYISCEASNVSLIDTLYHKGYTMFKLIHQSFDFNPIDLKLEKHPLFPLFLHAYASIKLKLHKLIRVPHPYSSSGPIPEKAKGTWLPYETARQLHTDFFQGDKMTPLCNKSWFDFHATY